MTNNDFEDALFEDTETSIFSDINVTPLVDVVLVLLIIFMVTAPMMQHEVGIELPRAKTKEMTTKTDSLVLVITKESEIFIAKNKFSLDSLDSKLKVIYDNRRNKDIFIKADKNINYGFVIKVMAAIKKAGLDRIGLVSLPE